MAQDKKIEGLNLEESWRLFLSNHILRGGAHMFIRYIFAGVAMIAVAAWQAPVQAAGVATYWDGGGLSLEIAPLPVEPATAFFLNRGFPYKKAMKLAQTGCIFRSAIGHTGKNADEAPVRIDVSQWSLQVDVSNPPDLPGGRLQLGNPRLRPSGRNHVRSYGGLAVREG